MESPSRECGQAEAEPRVSRVPMRFGISTHLYHDQRLSRDHLVEIAAHGFESIELFATRSHFDYHDESAIAKLEAWLRDAGLTLHGIHAPVTESFLGGAWGPPFSTATTDSTRRARAVQEANHALQVARRIHTGFLVVHLGTPTGQTLHRGDNGRDAAIRSLEELDRLASPLDVRVAAEVIPNDLSTAGSLVHMLEDELELPGVGICMDFGHAFLMGDLVDSIETASGHLITTHIHDNGGTRDDHLVPFDGAIDWPGALTAAQKIGYDGTLLLELGNTSTTPKAVLEQAQGARTRFERILRA